MVESEWLQMPLVQDLEEEVLAAAGVETSTSSSLGKNTFETQSRI